MILQSKIISLHWDDRKTAVQEATLEVEHEPSGDRVFFVIPVLRMSEHIRPAERRKKDDR